MREPTMVALDAEDQKLVVLARSTRARAEASQGAALRDSTGRTYAAATVALPSLSLSALQLAVAMAVSSGAREVEAAVVVGESASDGPGLAAVRDLAPDAAVYFADPNGQPRSV
jgi:cytidine deaminase